MSLPNLFKVEEFLRPFMVANSGDRLRFGHIKIPPYRFGSEGLIDSVRRMYSASHSKMLFIVAPDVEEIEEESSESVATPVEVTFPALFNILQENRGDNGWVSRKSKDPHAEWIDSNLLPQSITLVMWLDPEMSASCALSLIGIVKWAAQVSQNDHADVSVVTMAVGKDDILSKVVSSFSPSAKVAQFDLSAESEQDSLVDCLVQTRKDIEQIAMLILQSFREVTTKKRLVISFDTGLHRVLKSQFQKNEGLSFEFLYINANTPTDVLKRFKGPLKRSCTRVVTFMCAASLLPFEFKHLDEVHIVLASNMLRDKVWDKTSAQVTTKSRPTSDEERQLQLWWAHQPSTGSRTVYIPAATAHLFAQSGPRPYLVENAHIGGFIASAVDLVTWGIDLQEVLRHFIRYPLRYREMMERLKYQRVIKPDDSGLALSEAEVVKFRALLTHFEFDHRLALMVALDCDATIRYIKVHIAVLLMDGVTDVAEIQKPDPKDLGIRKDIMKRCRGPSPFFRNGGVLWLVLGLLGGLDTGAPSSASAPGVAKEILSVQKRNLDQRTRLVERILNRLYDLETDLDTDTAWKFEKFSTTAEKQLQNHLLRSFIFQLTMVHYNKVDGKRLPEHGHSFKIITTFTNCSMGVPSNQSLASLFNVDFLLKKGDGLAFVIAHDLGRNANGILFSRFWTSVPEEPINEWLSQWSNDKTLFQVLNTGIQHI